MNGLSQLSPPNHADERSPLISIITVVYNREKTLRRAVESVVGQTCDSFEYVVIDGASTDGSMEILNQYEDRIDVLVSEPDKGMYYALNKGIERATGEFIGIVHSDDFLVDENVLSSVAKQMREHDADIFHGDALSLTHVGERAETTKLSSTHANILQTAMSMVHPASFIRRSIFRKIGGYDTEFRSAADYEFFVRCVKSGLEFLHIDTTVCCIDSNPDGRVSNNCFAHLEAYRFHKRHQTGNHRKYLLSYLNCRMRSFVHKFVSPEQRSKLRGLIKK